MKSLRRIGVAALVLVIATAALLEAQSTSIIDQEIQGFGLPGGNTKGYRVHGSRTEMNLTLPVGDIRAVGGYKAPFTFAHTELVASLSSNAMPIAGTTNSTAGSTTPGVQFQRMPYAGSIIAVSIGASTALTANAAHAEATVLTPGQSTASRTGLTAVIGFGLTNTTFATATQARKLSNFSSSDTVGCNLTTDASIAPTTAMIACTIVVEY